MDRGRPRRDRSATSSTDPRVAGARRQSASGTVAELRRPEIAQLLEQLRDRTAEVELDLPPSQSSGNAATAERLARARAAAIRRGDRVARTYELADGQRVLGEHGEAPRISPGTPVTENEARALVTAGATWTGPEIYTRLQGSTSSVSASGTFAASARSSFR